MPNPSLAIAVYCEFVVRPYFVVVHTRPQVGHDRFDQYRQSLAELMLSVTRQLTGGRSDILDKMCELDAADMAKSTHRNRRYIASVREELYAADSAHLDRLAAEFKDYRIGTNVDKLQAHSVVILACRAVGVPYHPMRKLVAFKGVA